MATTKDKKGEVLEKLKQVFAGSESVTFVNFHGLSVTDTNVLRSTLREAGVNYFVAKKTLIRKALEGSSTEGEIPVLDGELAVAYAENDPTSSAREIYTFAKKHDGKIVILGGVFEGEYKDQESMTEIASIPSIEVLRGMFVNVINSPIQGFVVALGAIAERKA